MSDFAPKPAQILRYAYLWRDDADAGAEEGSKDRPTVVVLVTQRENKQLRVIVAPITHTPSSDARDAIEIPAATCRRVGLDSARQWVVAAEVNAFTWPGPDLRPETGKGLASALMGYLPPNTFLRLRDRIVELGRERRFRVVERTGPGDDS